VRPGGWSQTIRPFSLPYGMDVVLGDVCGGSNSPSMVRLVAYRNTCALPVASRELFNGPGICMRAVMHCCVWYRAHTYPATTLCYSRFVLYIIGRAL
jgi:hypothetical protein